MLNSSVQICQLQKTAGSQAQQICWQGGDVHPADILCKEVLPVLEVSSIFQCRADCYDKTCPCDQDSEKKTWFWVPCSDDTDYLHDLGQVIWPVSSSDEDKVTSFLPPCLAARCDLFLFVTMPKKKLTWDLSSAIFKNKCILRRAEKMSQWNVYALLRLSQAFQVTDSVPNSNNLHIHILKASFRFPQ